MTALEMARLAIRYCITRIGFATVSKIVEEEDPANQERKATIPLTDYRTGINPNERR